MLTIDRRPSTLSDDCLLDARFPPSVRVRRRATSTRFPSEIRNELKSVETEIKYAGYLSQQQKAIERLKKAEQRTIPDWFDYAAVSGLSREMKEKLQRVRPRTSGRPAAFRA